MVVRMTSRHLRLGVSRLRLLQSTLLFVFSSSNSDSVEYEDEYEDEDEKRE